MFHTAGYAPNGAFPKEESDVTTSNGDPEDFATDPIINQKINDCKKKIEDVSSSNDVETSATFIKLQLAAALKKNSEFEEQKAEIIATYEQLIESHSKIFEEQATKLEESTEKIKQLEIAVEEERKDKKNIQENFSKLRNSVSNLSAEFIELNEQLQTHFMECCKNPANLDNAVYLQNRLDGLMLNTQDKFQVWETEQLIMQENLVDVKENIGKIKKCLEFQGVFLSSPAATATYPVDGHQLTSEDHTQQVQDSYSQEPEAPDGESTSQNESRIKQKESNSYDCDECENSYLSRAILQTHKKIAHTKPTWSSSTKQVETNHEKNETPSSSQKKSATKSQVANAPKSSSVSTSDSDDEDIMIIESDVPVKPFVFKTASPMISSMSKLALSFATPKPSTSSSVILIPPCPSTAGASVVPIKIVPKKARLSFNGKKHNRDITKRVKGFYCICGIKFISRKRLDGHINFHNVTKLKKDSRTTSKSTGDLYNDRTRTSEKGKIIKFKTLSAPNKTNSSPISSEPILIQKQTVHKIDSSKALRGFRCTCGLRFQNMKELHKHVTPLRKPHKNVEQKRDNEMFTCMTCGQSFNTHVDRNRHRMQAHGHGLLI